LLQAKMLADPV